MKGWGALVRWVVPFLMGGALGSGVTYYLSQQPGERAEAEYTSSFVRPFQAVPQDMAAFPCTRRTRFENAFSPCENGLIYFKHEKSLELHEEFQT